MCATVLCGQITETCADGTVVSCDTVCNSATGVCEDCGLPACPGGSIVTCPAIGPPPEDFCLDGFTKEEYDSNGCLTGYYCDKSDSGTGGGGGYVPYCGDGFCEPDEKDYCTQDCGTFTCPDTLNPVCGYDGLTHANECEANRGEITGFECYGECPCGQQVNEWELYTRTCEDGTEVSVCDKCPLPSECFEKVDESGFVHVVCETDFCPEIYPEQKDKCFQEGGEPRFRTDYRGCEYLECRFEDYSGGFFRPGVCPTHEEVKQNLQKCEEFGHEARIVKEGDCEVARCVDSGQFCGEIPLGFKEEMENRCSSEGLGIVKIFDDTGCPTIVCQGQDVCRRYVPEEAYSKCDMQGGELIVKRSHDNECIEFVDCVRRGDYRDDYYEDVDHVPDAAVLLQLALKLEELRIKFDQLVKKTEDIALYYDSVGSTNDAEKFRRAADIFESVKKRIDEIKLDLRDSIDDLTIEDIREAKHRLKQLVSSLRDAAYIMLSSSDELGEFDNDPTSATGCGFDGECFDRAFRICKPTTFQPERGVIVTIEGLDGNNCIMKAKVTDAPIDISMTCSIPDYSFGIEDHVDVITKYCQGTMADMIRSGEFGEGGPGGHGGPGGCTTERECRAYCESPENLVECKEFAQAQGFTGPGGCFGSECELYCRENPRICYQWCIDNPGFCPEERRASDFDREFDRQVDGTFDEYPERDFSRESDFESGNACVGCLNNNVCDIGECSECRDCGGLKMKLIAILLIGLMLLTTVAVSGCTQLGDVRTADDASQTLGEVSQDIGEVQDIINEIDQTLG